MYSTQLLEHQVVVCLLLQQEHGMNKSTLERNSILVERQIGIVPYPGEVTKASYTMVNSLLTSQLLHLILRQ